jgi:FMN hydrolase / 5-amino-6-(5-phospho-D-ribitylamino)uracil phosphatase
MSDTRTPSALLFDVMDTLVVDPFRHEMPRFFRMTLEEMLAAKDPHAWVDFELSKIDEQTFFETFFADRRAFDGPALRERVRAAYGFVPGVEPILSSLASLSVPMHALSNYPCWYELIEERLALSRHLSRRFVSFETGVRKPDLEAYTGAAHALGLSPEACLFIDDRASNCAAAQRVGMDAIVFEGADALREALGLRGLRV